MKKILMIAIAAIAFVACKKDDSKDPTPNGIENTPIGKEYFTVADASYSAEALPAATTSDQFAAVNMNGSVLNGGSSIVTIESDVVLTEFLVSVQGVTGHYSFDAEQVTVSRAEGEYVYQFTMLISQQLGGGFTVRISARNAQGHVMPAYTHEFGRIEAGTGALQINLSFNRNKDLDLHVELPDGSVVDYRNEGRWDEAGLQIFGLDIDSNAACDIDGINSENIFFPTEYVMNGKYTVYVNLYSNCYPRDYSTQWTVTALRNGALLIPSYGNNPRAGSFAADALSNTADKHSNWEGAVKVMEFTVAGAALNPDPDKPLVGQGNYYESTGSRSPKK